MSQESTRRQRRWTGLAVALVLALAAACGSDDDTPLETAPTAPVSTAGSTTLPSSTVPEPTVPATTAPRSTAPRSTAPPATPATTAPVPEPDPGPARTVPLGLAFTIAVGETVGVIGEGLTVTYSQFVSDNRCPIGVQCITAGNAQIVVTVAKAGSPPAGLTLNTTEGPTSAGYLNYTVALVQLSRNASPAGSLRIT